MRKNTIKYSILFLTLASLSLHSPPAQAGFLDFLKNLFSLFKTNKHADPSTDKPVFDPNDKNEPEDNLDVKAFCPDGKTPNPDFASHQYIMDLAENKECTNYKWQNRGKAPQGYIEGMLLVYARQHCDTINSEGYKKIISAKDSQSSKDIWGVYKNKAKNKEGSAANTFALLIGLGMRESSGKYCTGRDGSARNTSASTAEAGLFQTSYNTVGINSEMKKIFEDYKAGKKQCFTETFGKKVSCNPGNWANYGIGDGREFQKLSKNCPAFAAEIAAVNIRVNKNHYGPLVREEVEFRNSCVSLLESVESAIAKNPNLCPQILRAQGKPAKSDLPLGEQLASSCTETNPTPVVPAQNIKPDDVNTNPDSQQVSPK